MEEKNYPQKAVIKRLPQDDEELWWTVFALWGYRIPRHRVCPDHIAPFDAFSEAYFAREPMALWKGCVPGDSLVTTSHGLRRIDRIKSGTKVLGWKNGNLSWGSVVSKWISSLDDPVLGLVTEHGTLRCTGTHRVLVKRDAEIWVEAKDIVVGDLIVQPTSILYRFDSKSDRVYRQITEIKDLGKQVVWDMEVSGTETFVCDSFVVHNSRGLSGKSRTLALLSLTEATLLGCEVTVLGGSFAQSMNVHDATKSAWEWHAAPKYLLDGDPTRMDTKLTNGGHLRTLTASQTSVRGPHPPRLRMDEIDEMDQEILDAALGQPMEQYNYLGVKVPTQVILCVAEDTFVFTKRGEVKISEVTTDDYAMTRKGWRRITAVINNGKRSTVDLVLSNGRILTCTDDHKIATPNGWLAPREMKLGQEVCGVASGLPLSEVSVVLGDTVGVSSGSGSSFVFSSPETRAGTTFSPPATALETSVPGSVLVPSGAVSLLGVDGGGSVTPEDVLPHGDIFEMGRVTTGSVLTEMVEGVANLSNQTNVSPAMDVPLEVSSIHPSISSTLTTIPKPATSDFVYGALALEPVFVVDILASSGHELTPVYDITVDDAHEFIANGIIVHNCSTHQYAEGTMARMMRRAKEKDFPIRTWCVAAGSKIITNAGEIPIENVNKSHSVLTRNGWKKVQHVTYMGNKETIPVTVGDKTVRVTRDHLIFTDEGWMRADEVNSDRVSIRARLTDQGHLTWFEFFDDPKLESVLNLDVWDIGVHGEHEFFANGILVHNCYKETSNKIDGWLTEEAIERTKSLISEQMWKTEYELQEPSSGSRAIDTNAVDAAFDPDLGTYTNVDEVVILPRENGRHYITAVDWAKSQDKTIIVTFDTTELPWLCVSWRMVSKLPWPELVAAAVDQWRRYGDAFIHDSTGVGAAAHDIIAEQVTQVELERVKGLIMSGGRARDAFYTEYISAIEHGDVRYPRITLAYEEHKGVTSQDLFTGQGHAPDTVVAGALAWAARRKRSVPVVGPSGGVRAVSPWDV